YFCLATQRTFDIIHDLSCTLHCAVHLCQHHQGSILSFAESQVSGRFRYHEQQKAEEQCRYCFRSKHITPSHTVDPIHCLALGDTPVHKIDHQHSEDDGKLVEGDKPAPNMSR